MSGVRLIVLARGGKLRKTRLERTKVSGPGRGALGVLILQHGKRLHLGV